MAKSIATGTSWRVSVVVGEKVVQRQVFYLGEINDSQRAAWCQVIEAFDENMQERTQLALSRRETERVPEYTKGYGVQVRLEAMELHRPWARVGWPVISMGSLSSISFGKCAWLIHVRAPVGAIFSNAYLLSA